MRKERKHYIGTMGMDQFACYPARIGRADLES
jgi:hypothetical protein